MITETLLNSLKSLFSSLGAKTSDSNYAVGLFDKTNGEPNGMMGMSDLASVLGAVSKKGDLTGTVDLNTLTEPGIWSINTNSCTLNNAPQNYDHGILIVFSSGRAGGGYPAVQIYCGLNDLFIRTKWATGWNSWHRITFTS